MREKREKEPPPLFSGEKKKKEKKKKRNRRGKKSQQGKRQQTSPPPTFFSKVWIRHWASSTKSTAEFKDFFNCSPLTQIFFLFLCHVKAKIPNVSLNCDRRKSSVHCVKPRFVHRRISRCGVQIGNSSYFTKRVRKS